MTPKPGLSATTLKLVPLPTEIGRFDTVQPSASSVVLAEIGSRGKLGGQGVTGAERGQSRQRIGEAGLGHHGGERGDALIRLALGARGRERLQHGCVRGQRAEPEARSTVPKHVVEFARRHIDSEITSLVNGHARAREFVQEGIAGLHD